MKKSIKFWIQFFAVLALVASTQLLISCSGDENSPAIMEDTQVGLNLLESEFSPCVGEVGEPDVPFFLRDPSQFDMRNSNQASVEAHLYSSLNQMYPSRGSWRKSKAEIMDVVDRYLWSPEHGRGVRLLHYFDMVLLINVGDRQAGDPENNSAQRMQVLVRNGDTTNQLENWQVIETWPISSGYSCKTANGEKVETLTGVFKFDPNRMHSSYKSREWDGIDMYETMFLYSRYINPDNPGNPDGGQLTGIAIHGTTQTDKLGRRVSGGCIRLARENSKCLYETIQGTRSSTCLSGGRVNYKGMVPSFQERFGEADPEFLSGGRALEVYGRKVLIAIYDEKDATL